MSRETLNLGETEMIKTKLEEIEKLLKHKAPITADPILTSEEVMRYLSISRRLLQNWRDEGRIEYSAVKGKFYFRISQIEKMLNKHLVKMAD